MLKSLARTAERYIRSFEFHARHFLPRLQYLEVQSIIILQSSEDQSGDSGTKIGVVDTYCFELLDLFLEVSVLGMVLLVLGTRSDALGQLHFWSEYWDGLASLQVILGRQLRHTPGEWCL